MKKCGVTMKTIERQIAEISKAFDKEYVNSTIDTDINELYGREKKLIDPLFELLETEVLNEREYMDTIATNPLCDMDVDKENAAPAEGFAGHWASMIDSGRAAIAMRKGEQQ